MPVTHPAGPVRVQRATLSGTDMLIVQGAAPSKPRTRAVIALHGFSNAATVDANLAQWLAWRWHSVTATGRTVICPHTGDTWANSTAMTHIDNAVDAATSLGFTDEPHLLGLSMGALNAQAWGLANPTGFAGMFIVAPAYDLGAIYDLGSFTTSLNTAWGTASRSALLTATSAVDPVRNRTALAAFGDRVHAFSARDDTIIYWTGLEGLAEDAGYTLTASAPEGESGGGHLFWELAQDWDEYLFIRHFDAHE